MDNWLINGEEHATLPVTDRGLLYGDGLFETLAVRGGQCRFRDAHLDRLAQGCRRLGIPSPDRQQIISELDQLSVGATHATLKIIITRGTGPRGYRPPEPCKPTRILGLQHTTAPARLAGVYARYCATLISRNPALAGIKTLNRLEQVLARAEWDDNDFAEGLMLTDRGNVVCGTMSNIFFTLADSVYTPDLHECGVSGIMRQMILQVARSQGLVVREQTVSKADLENADDVFLSNALIGVWPVAELAGRKYQRSAATIKIMQGLFALGVVECGA